MKTLLLFSASLLLVVATRAQGNLQFSKALIISDALTTVPNNTVWKVTSIYGSEFTASQCVNHNSSFDWLGLKCNSNFADSYYINNHSVSLSYFSTKMLVNGVQIANEVTGMPSSVATKIGNTCSGSTNYSNQNFTCANRSVNPNLMPMWLPAGTTLQTGGPNTFISVLEFNIIP